MNRRALWTSSVSSGPSKATFSVRISRSKSPQPLPYPKCHQQVLPALPELNCKPSYLNNEILALMQQIKYISNNYEKTDIDDWTNGNSQKLSIQ